ncbi:hypothetical protein PENANT_c303G03986, partial [Penicillium antarcticum]
SLARDVLTTLASGSSVKRLFNSARDICHYRRGSLKPQTIQDLMIFICTAKFDMDSEQLALIEEYLSTQEKQAESERKDTERKKEEGFDSISDNKEDPSTTKATQPSSERTLRKRRAETTSDNLIQLDDTNKVPLPNNSHL